LSHCSNPKVVRLVRIIRSRAPLRISFSGGGTDVPPYPAEKGGAVLNVTINKYSYATLIPTPENEGITVKSLDYDIVAKYITDKDFRYDGKLDLIKAVLKNMGLKGGARLFLHSDAPPGSGLGSSSTMAVTLVGLLKHYLSIPMTDYEIAEKAYQIERIDLGVPGGLQDQYAATFGGFNFIEFLKDRVIVNPLRIKREVLNELEYHLLLCYTGASRVSANILNEQVAGYVDKKVDVVKALDETKKIAVDMKNALLTGELNTFGQLFHKSWLHKKQFSTKITNPIIDKLYDVATSNGAMGGKILGAGGGGYMLFYCEFEKKHKVAEALEKAGGQIVDFGFEFKGLQTWEIDTEKGT
jgi:D-glycero-alpha-D-manno-heptose-7-phosphate kinase